MARAITSTSPCRHEAATRAAGAAILAVGLLVASFPATAEQPSPGPVSVSADGFEYLLHDRATGGLTLGIFADTAQARGDAADLTTVTLLRYAEGRVTTRVTANEGQLVRNSDTRLTGDVDLRWNVDATSAKFSCAELLWRRDTNEMRSDSQVWGIIRGANAAEADEPAEGEGLVVRIIGTGLVVASEGRRGEIPADVELHVSGAKHGPWIVTADGGLTFDGDDDSMVLRLRGPIQANGSQIRWSADAAEFSLVSSGEDELVLRRCFATGTVQASGKIDGVGPDPQGRGTHFEAWAGAAEVGPAGPAVLMGTPEEPARVLFRHGEFRGTTVELGPGVAKSDGGATSVFEWERQR